MLFLVTEDTNQSTLRFSNKRKQTQIVPFSIKENVYLPKYISQIWEKIATILSVYDKTRLMPC